MTVTVEEMVAVEVAAVIHVSLCPSFAVVGRPRHRLCRRLAVAVEAVVAVSPCSLLRSPRC